MTRDPDFSTVLRTRGATSEFLTWLLDDNGHSATSTRAFLDVCFLHLTPQKRSAVTKEISNSEAEAIEHMIYELVAHELLFRLKVNPEFKPSERTYRPDLAFGVKGQRFIADVFATSSPQKTIRRLSDDSYESIDTSDPAKSRAHKIAERLREKAGKYSSLGLPFVAVVFVGDSNVDVDDAERALFGMTVREAEREADFPTKIDLERIRVGGLLLPDEDGRMHYGNLSAVIVCDWFDTLNNEARGKRLHCVVLHNWAGVPLPVETFNGFPQVVWTETRQRVWHPNMTGAGNIVARFAEDDRLELKPYSPNAPW